jgi:hypothetical protein
MMLHMANQFTEGATVMYTAKALAEGIQGHVVRWLVKGPGASWVVAGTMAFAGLSAAALNAPATHPDSSYGTSSSTMQVTYSGCWSDPDGDGHIFCDSSVSISNLPASFGDCSNGYDGNIFCDGISR